MDVIKTFSLIYIYYISSLVPKVLAGDDDHCQADKDEEQFVAACRQQTPFFLTNLQSLDITLNYDAGIYPDANYIKNMCKMRQMNFKHVTFTFRVGLSVKKPKDFPLQCLEGCIYSYMDACAYTLLGDSKFTDYVCCSYATEYDITIAKQCVQKYFSYRQIAMFEQCVNLQHPTIKPDQILLNNSNIAKSKHPKEFCYPFVNFNGQIDRCAKYMFYDDPLYLICDMMAPGLELACMYYGSGKDYCCSYLTRVDLLQYLLYAVGYGYCHPDC